ncbi:amidohydrolase [Salinirarus marinus]|uniref:amidohydrolase n=1 Tax=Salinirarus marinus TaxID=3068310 RepID=UPI003C6C789F
MTEAADLLLTNAEVHTLARPDETHEAVAVRDGEIVRVGSAYELDFLAGVETRTVDLDGRVLLPGFVDAHTHLSMVGRALVHADLSGASGPAECASRLQARADEVAAGEFVLGFRYDESEWDESRYLTRDDLDDVDAAGPVVAFREDLHVAALDSTALDRLLPESPDRGVRRENGEPTGVVVGGALDSVYAAIEPDAAEMHELLTVAQAEANARGVTGVHDVVRGSRAPEVYRDLDREGELTLRVRLNYWSDHLDALVEAGLHTGHGTDMVEVGAIKTYTDGTIGGRTAKLSEPYDDAEGAGEWVVPPAEFRDILAAAEDAGFQVAAHAIGDVAVDAVLNAYASSGRGARHRVEHLELASDDAVARIADLDVVASVQPNFLKWGGDDGLYAARLGDRWTDANRFRALADAGATLAFGSDCMPLAPLYGVHQTVNAPVESQRLGVTEALRAYTLGAAYAGFDEGRLGTIEAGKRADLVALDRSPWAQPDAIADLDVAVTVVDGRLVYDDR